MRVQATVLITLILLVSCAGEENLKADKLNKSFLEASGRGDLENVKNHLEVGADINSRNADGNTAVHLAVENEDTSLLKLLVEKEADLNIKNTKGMTPLHQAIQMMDFDGNLLSMLLDKGADPNIADNDGNTVLHLSLKAGIGNISVLTLIDKGADINMKNNEGKTPLDVGDDIRDFSLIRKHGGKVTKAPENIVQAAKYGDMGKLREFLDADVDINMEDEYGRTALHWAAECNEVDMVHLLIGHGSNIAVKAAGDTPFHLAIRAGNCEIVEIFIGREADIYEISWISDAWVLPIHLAVDSGNIRMIEMLLDKGANVDSPNYWSETPLHHAVIARKKEAVAFLIRRGANINKKDDGDTPLDVSKDAEITKLLIENGAKTGKIESEIQRNRSVPAHRLLS
jgi:ankyrin repeat protein